MKRLLSFLTAGLIAAGCTEKTPLQPAPPSFSAFGQSESQNLEYLAASDFLCDLAEDACPNVSRASNGDMLELTGSGTLTTHPKSVTGSGTFTHKDADGDVLGSGTWEAKELLSFRRYGSQTLQDGTVLVGGTAVIRVLLSAGPDAILQIDCAIGKTPGGHSPDGVKLAIQDVINFNKIVGGLTVFIEQ